LSLNERERLNSTKARRTRQRPSSDCQLIRRLPLILQA